MIFFQPWKWRLRHSLNFIFHYSLDFSIHVFINIRDIVYWRCFYSSLLRSGNRLLCTLHSLNMSMKLLLMGTSEILTQKACEDTDEKRDKTFNILLNLDQSDMRIIHISKLPATSATWPAQLGITCNVRNLIRAKNNYPRSCM